MSRFILVVASFFFTSHVFANATIPKADIAGAKDSPVVGRFAGSYIVSYEKMDYDEFLLPLSPLKPVADENKRDANNNRIFEPAQSKQLEGKRTHLVYLLPANISPLQALRNYQQELLGKEGKMLFECASEACGGNPKLGSAGGGSQQSLGMKLWPQNRIKDTNFSNGHCALASRINDQRYAAFELPKQNAFLSVLAYTVKDDLYCKAFHERTIVRVDLLERKAMEQKMVTVKAEEMAQSINTNGRVALYGLYFDSGKADVKPESKATLDQIAKLLTSTPAMKLLVVGHTDNVGEFGWNMDLSKRRAEAVAAALAGQYRIDRKRLTPVGVSFASPVAANTSEAGKAKNRRVELVPDN